MMPTTEIELNEVSSSLSSPKKQTARNAAKKASVKAGAAFNDLRKSYKETTFTPVALRPVDKSVI